MDKYTVIGFDTREPKHGLPLFKVSDFKRSGVKATQDAIAANQAMRSPHIIYTVVLTSDLWW
jgi:hypothetical protein